MRTLTNDDCNRVLELLGYYPDFGDPEGFIRISDGLATGPKAFFFRPLDPDESVEADILAMWLRLQGLPSATVDAAIRKVAGP